jgi:predicted metal-dependent hydrolase
LEEFNHSKRFWALVSKTIPDYKEIRKIFKRIYLSRILAFTIEKVNVGQ